MDATKTIMCSLVLLKLDYCNSLLSGSPQYLIQVLQKLQNTAAHITLKVPRVEQTSPLLCSFHWLSIKKRIKHKVCSICYSTLTGTTSKYMSELVNVYIPMSLPSSTESYSINILCKNQDLWAVFLCLSRTSYME